MTNGSNRQILLASLPNGKLGPEHFQAAESPIPAPAAGEALVRTRYVAIDAANRAWMLGATYRAGLSAGQVMDGLALGEVVESRDAGLRPGDLVTGQLGWQDYAVIPAEALRKVEPVEPLSHLLSIYGVAGLTAYFGLLECAPPKAGETVVVSAAAGAVGLIVGQIAKLKGCRVVGIAGGEAKCAQLTGEFGFDAAVDYKAHGENLFGLIQAIQAAAGGGVDVFFDNVGGLVMDACLFAMNPFGRVACCGAVSAYDGVIPYGVRGLATVVSKRVRIQGFIVSDFRDRFPEALADLRTWVETGQIVVQEDILDGLDALPGGLIGLLAGENVGKRIVRVS